MGTSESTVNSYKVRNTNIYYAS